MNGKTPFVITLEENGKYFSYADVIRNHVNLVYRLPTNAITINACDTRKEAKAIAEAWNESWKQQGKFSYDVSRKFSSRNKDVPDYTPQYNVAVEKLGKDIADKLFSDPEEFGNWIDRMLWHVKKCSEYHETLQKKEREESDNDYPHDFHMQTKAGVVSAYFYPGSYGPQLSIQWKPEGCDTEVDLVCIECKEDAGLDTDPDKIHVYLYRDISTEDWTDKFSLSAVAAQDVLNDDEEE